MEVNQAATRERVRAPRYKISRDLTVLSKTIGTEIAFKLETENVSRSGLLLNWGQTRPIPFLENTIVEMTIDPRGEVMGRAVTCLGKVVRRRGNHTAGDLQFGVSIIQIDNADLEAWEECLSELSANGIEISPPAQLEYLDPALKKAS